MQLHEDAALSGSELDVVGISGRCRAQSIGECARQPAQEVAGLVMRGDGQSIEVGEGLVDPDEAQAHIAQSQADWDVPDRVQEAPGGVLFGRGGRNGR